MCLLKRMIQQQERSRLGPPVDGAAADGMPPPEDRDERTTKSRGEEARDDRPKVSAERSANGEGDRSVDHSRSGLEDPTRGEST